MAAPTFVPIARTVGAVAAVTLAACGGSTDQGDVPASQKLNPARAPRVSGPCPATSPNGRGRASSDGFNHGDRSLAVALWPQGELVAGPLPDGGSYAEIKPDGSIVAKLGWWRGVEGRLTIRGERLDGRSAPLRAAVPQSGYGPTGFLPSLLTFPTQGCWRVAGNIGRANVTFVLLVRKR